MKMSNKKNKNVNEIMRGAVIEEKIKITKKIENK